MLMTKGYRPCFVWGKSKTDSHSKLSLTARTCLIGEDCTLWFSVVLICTLYAASSPSLVAVTFTFKLLSVTFTVVCVFMVMYPAFIIGVTKVENNRIKNKLSITFKYIYSKNFAGSSLQLDRKSTRLNSS